MPRKNEKNGYNAVTEGFQLDIGRRIQLFCYNITMSSDTRKALIDGSYV